MPGAIDIAMGRTRKDQPAPPAGMDDLFGETVARPVSFAQVEAQLLVDALQNWTSRGYAITLSRTSDGGAISISLLAGEWRKKLYAGHPDELTSILERVADVGASTINGHAVRSHDPAP